MQLPMSLVLYRIINGFDGPITVDEVHALLISNYGIRTTRHTVINRLYELSCEGGRHGLEISKVCRGVYIKKEKEP